MKKTILFKCLCPLAMHLAILTAIGTAATTAATTTDVEQIISTPSYKTGIPNALILGPLRPTSLKVSKQISRANPIYFRTTKDKNITSICENTSNKLEAHIARFGFIDVERFQTIVNPFKASMHLTAIDLFHRLVVHYGSSPYIGTADSVYGEGATSWFGGISAETLLMISDFAYAQAKLPRLQKMKFLGVGSGNSFFEWILSHIGKTTAMDVIDERLRNQFYLNIMNFRDCDDLVTRNKLGDFGDVERKFIEKNFFMPTQIYEQNSDDDIKRIIEDTFSDADYPNTILVLSWPRAYANNYIRHFIKNRGNAILFVRNQAVETVFHASHLGEPTLGNSAFGIQAAFNLGNFRKTSFDLNTSTFSTVDLYCRGAIHPLENALQATIDQLRTLS